MVRTNVLVDAAPAYHTCMTSTMALSIILDSGRGQSVDYNES